jgi:hypothetical protein
LAEPPSTLTRKKRAILFGVAIIHVYDKCACASPPTAFLTLVFPVSLPTKLTELESGKLSFPNDRDGILYIQTGGAALNTRLKDDAGSTWRENKLGEVFSSKDIYLPIHLKREHSPLIAHEK